MIYTSCLIPPLLQRISASFMALNMKLTPPLKKNVFYHRGPKGHNNIGILHTMVAGIVFVLGRRARMQDPSAYGALRAPTQYEVEADVGDLIIANILIHTSYMGLLAHTSNVLRDDNGNSSGLYTWTPKVCQILAQTPKTAQQGHYVKRFQVHTPQNRP